jgi:hypothetical protein
MVVGEEEINQLVRRTTSKVSLSNRSRTFPEREDPPRGEEEDPPNNNLYSSDPNLFL